MATVARSACCIALHGTMKGGVGKHGPDWRKRQLITQAMLNTKRRKKDEADPRDNSTLMFAATVYSSL
jgi:hypothetical protein